VRNFAGLAALFGEGAEGKRRGEMGLLIGTAGARIGQASMRIEEGVTASSGGYWRENRTEEEDD
jgi:hypothetical protein